MSKNQASCSTPHTTSQTTNRGSHTANHTSNITHPKSHIPYQKYLPSIILALFIISYILYFSWYTINRHNTLNSYTADLSLIDQPMWNTALGPGGFMELTWGTRQQPRLAEHFEPILIPLSLLFIIWDDVRIQLIAQTVALALGALPVFWIARSQLTISNDQLTNNDSSSGPYTDTSKVQNPKSKIINRKSSWAALVFALAYLLYPHLQAANIADFHADPFVVAPLLFAFWYATQQRWLWMWVWAIVAMLSKENLPTLTGMLGVLLVIDYFYTKATQNSLISKLDFQIAYRKSKFQNGLALIVVSAGWFIIATFFIVSPLAQQYFGTDGPIYLANRFNQETSLWQMLQEPARWQYVIGLFAAVGFLPLLAPELLILGLPVLAANLLSNFPGQYSGEQHYSAPLVAVFVLAAIYGTRRLINNVSLREVNGQSLRTSVLIAACLWVLGLSLAYHAAHGWTPFSTRTESYTMSPAAIALPELMAQIPDDAVVSASAGIHPHLAHRQTIYVFPTVEDATYLLVDITDVPGNHPNDTHARLVDMLNTDWQLLTATDGLLLAKKSTETDNSSTLPDDFYSFTQPTGELITPAPVLFGDGDLRLLGYALHDDPDDGITFRFYWQAVNTLPDNLRLWPLIYDDFGQMLADPPQVPMIATVWHPPDQWPIGNVIVTETLPQLLPDTFHLGVAVGNDSGSFTEPNQRWSVQTNNSVAQPYP